MAYKKVPEEQLRQMMDFMDEQMKTHEKPKVGFFNFSPSMHDLFGVIAVDAKEQNAIEQLNASIYASGLKPYGKVVYLADENKYIIKVGSWIEKYPEVEGLVKIEFNLENEDVEIMQDTNYEIEIDDNE